MGSGWVWAAIVACFPKRGPLPNGRWRDLAAGRWLLDVGAQRIRYLPCDVHHHSSRVFTPWWRVRHWPHWQASSGCLRGNRALGGVVRLPPPPAVACGWCRGVSWMCGRVACLGLREGTTRCDWRSGARGAQSSFDPAGVVVWDFLGRGIALDLLKEGAFGFL